MLVVNYVLNDAICSCVLTVHWSHKEQLSVSVTKAHCLLYKSEEYGQFMSDLVFRLLSYTEHYCLPKEFIGLIGPN